MSNAVAISMGGRVASIYRRNKQKYRQTKMHNDMEVRRLDILKRHIETNEVSEYHKLNR